jgi:hypothetical protein
MAATNWKQGDLAFDITGATFGRAYTVGALDSRLRRSSDGRKRSRRTPGFRHTTCLAGGHVRDISGVRANEST